VAVIMGKACIRFRTLNDLPLDLVGRVISRIPVTKFIQAYEWATEMRPR
jgi:hypothetical protein